MTPYIITAGEPAGIGPDCIIRAWRLQPQAFENCIIAAPSCWITARAEQIGADIVIEEFSTLAAAENAVSISKTNRLVCWNPLPPGAALCQVNPGSPSGSTARAVIDCIAAAANACLQGDASGLITGPIEKAALRSTGFNFPGHTEFLAHLASEYGNCQHDFVMMLASDELRVALLTTHMALRDVPDAISIVETVKSLRIVEQDLRNRFGIRNPKLALCALNPHAGEQGHFGSEEADILTPAVEQARQHGISVEGPLSADTLFSAPVRTQYHAILCCYHDQALIPLKTLSFGEAVNVTLGLPFIRTSVDHGTALDRVGGEDVSSTSLLAAIEMARRMRRP